ncbi:MAG: ABC transporter ATP-binding protein [Erysipelotrichaceae bacterium]
MSFIKFTGVQKKYQVGEVEIKALNGVDFEINKGELVIIAGASGAGKSTILNLLGGMDKCSYGDISVDGNLVSQYNIKELTLYRRHDIGFVFQFYNLMQNLTALENVELAVQICHSPLDPKEIIEAVGLTDRANNFPAQLSGGEQQRVAIARALAKNPKLLLCDEPTGALDYKTGKAILKLLQQMCQKLNMTIVIITHNLALCEMGNRVIKVRNGVVESNTINNTTKSIDEIEW